MDSFLEPSCDKLTKYSIHDSNFTRYRTDGILKVDRGQKLIQIYILCDRHNFFSIVRGSKAAEHPIKYHFSRCRQLTGIPSLPNSTKSGGSLKFILITCVTYNKACLKNIVHSRITIARIARDGSVWWKRQLNKKRAVGKISLWGVLFSYSINLNTLE